MNFDVRMIQTSKLQTDTKFEISVKFYIENCFLKFKLALKPFADTTFQLFFVNAQPSGKDEFIVCLPVDGVY